MAEAVRRSDLALRLSTAAVWAPFLIYLLYWAPRGAFPVVAAIVCALGALELFAMLAPEHRLLQGWAAVASVGVLSLLGFSSLHGWLPLATVTLTCVGMLVVLLQPEPVERAALRMGWAIAGPLYMGALFGTTVLLYQHAHGGSWVMLALMCGFFSDTVGYFVGRRLGRRRLAPIVSPKKTVEGAFGGLAGGLLGGLLAHFWYLQELALPNAIALSLVATAIGQAGDLCESLIKRSMGVKDSGTMLPGHGGILDRSDAMLFSAATIWAYLELLRV